MVQSWLEGVQTEEYNLLKTLDVAAFGYRFEEYGKRSAVVFLLLVIYDSHLCLSVCVCRHVVLYVQLR